MCAQTPPNTDLRQGRCLDPGVIGHIAGAHPQWLTERGDCPACVQQAILQTRLMHGVAAMHSCIQQVWPIDAHAAFGALPTPLRLHADPRFSGKGITIAHIDAGFYPHPDLVKPVNRIRAWAETTGSRVQVLRFAPDAIPEWPGWNRHEHWQWHGLMTSAAAYGNGFLSYGLYCGLASSAELVLVQTWDKRGRITNATLTRALRWIRKKRKELNIRIVSISVAGDPIEPLRGNPVDRAVKELVDDGVTVIAASGNKCERNLVPPATAAEAITVGGLDDRNVFDREQHEVWHSSYDSTVEGLWKPEVVAPSLWVVAPVLPGSPVAVEARELFARRALGDESANARIAEMKMVTPHYQHVEGTSFAAPIIASVVACMLEANASLTPDDIRHGLMAAAYKVAGASDERQGAGAVDGGQAVAIAMNMRGGR
jgi:serine protease AprX